MGYRLSRRRFIQQGVAAGSALAAGIRTFGEQASPAQWLVESAPAQGTENGYVPLYFTSAEMRFVQTACDRLIPSDEVGPGAVELGVPEFIDRQLAGPFGFAETWYMQGPFREGREEQGWQSKRNPRELYRDAIAAIDGQIAQATDGQTFADLPTGKQDELLMALEEGDRDIRGVDTKLFFRWLLTNTKEGYFADPMYGGNRGMRSWRMLGFPGARGEFRYWVERHDERYPLPPVSVNDPVGDQPGSE